MSLSFLQSASSTSDLTTYTFASQNLGTAAGDRHIIVCVEARFSGLSRTISSVTIGGVSATISVQRTNSGGSDCTVTGIVIAAVPTGTTGDIVVTFSAGAVRADIKAYRVVSLASATAHDTDSSVVSTNTVNLDIPANGFAIGCVAGSGTQTFTWTNLTEDSDAVVESAMPTTSASASFVSAQTGLALTATPSTTLTRPCGCYASWGLSSGNRRRRLICGSAA